jgi:hypothetical protein
MHYCPGSKESNSGRSRCRQLSRTLRSGRHRTAELRSICPRVDHARTPRKLALRQDPGTSGSRTSNRCSRWQQWRKPQIPRPSATLPRQAGAGGMTKGRVAGTQFWRMSVESLSASVDRSTRTSMFSSLQRRKPLNFRYPIVGNCGRSIAMKMGIS